MIYDVFSVEAHGISNGHDALSCSCEGLLKSPNKHIARRRKKIKKENKNKKNKKNNIKEDNMEAQTKKVENKGYIKMKKW